jgi:alpha-amylase
MRFARSLSPGSVLVAAAVALQAACGNSGSEPTPKAPCGTRMAEEAAPQWARDAVFYEVFVRSFADSDGDGVGDLKGLSRRLDYLNDGKTGGADLDVGALWLMPIFRAASYHGYDTTDYESIDPAYGSVEDFQALAAQAHARGMHVILDLVLNHTSDRHPWFQASMKRDPARRDFYVWSPSDPGWSQPWSASTPAWHPAGGAFYYGLFWSGMPDLNYNNTSVRQEMIRVAKLWLDRGADGFRLDAARYLVESGQGAGQQDTTATHAYWKEFRTALKAYRPDVFLVGEAWADTATIRTYYGAGDELDAAFDFPLRDAAIKSLQSGNRLALDPVLCAVAQAYPQGALDAVFLGNHDLPRLAPQLQSDPARLVQAAALELTLPGAPFVYYGDEIGMKNGTLDGGDINYRTPMLWSAGPNAGFTSGTPWLPVNAEASVANVARENADPKSVLVGYRALIAAREACPALRGGRFVPVLAESTSASTAVVAYVRELNGSVAIVALNLGRTATGEVTLDLGSAGVPAVPLVDALSGRPAEPVSAANASSYPLDPLPPSGVRILRSAS